MDDCVAKLESDSKKVMMVYYSQGRRLCFDSMVGKIMRPRRRGTSDDLIFLRDRKERKEVSNVKPIPARARRTHV